MAPVRLTAMRRITAAIATIAAIGGSAAAARAERIGPAAPCSLTGFQAGSAMVGHG
jgi:hypothetical protein